MSAMVETLAAQEVIRLYAERPPGSKQAPDYTETVETGNDGRHYIARVSVPTLTVYKPAAGKSNGAAVIICPGGGYIKLAVDHEGVELARRFNEYGITAFVLKYRLPSDSIMLNKAVGPLQDAQRAIQLVRRQSAKFELHPDKIGIIGASAGGHLAGTAGTLFQYTLIDNPDSVSLRPDFMVLMYAALSFGALAHTSSAKNLIGNDTSRSKIDLFSCEKQVTKNTPPTFLVHAGDDKVVTPLHSIIFYQALLAKSVPAELHIYSKGGHGFGLHNKTTTDDWFERLMNWLRAGKFVPE